MNKYTMYSIVFFAMSTSYLTAAKESGVKVGELTELINKGICTGFTVQTWQDISHYVQKLTYAVNVGKIRDELKCQVIVQGINEIVQAYEIRNNNQQDKMFSHLLLSIDAFEKLNPKPEVRKQVLSPEEKFKRMYTKTI